MSKKEDKRPAFGTIKALTGGETHVTPRNFFMFDYVEQSTIPVIGEVVVFKNRDGKHYFQSLTEFERGQKVRQERAAANKLQKEQAKVQKTSASAPNPTDLGFALLSVMTPREKDDLLMRLLSRTGK